MLNESAVKDDFSVNEILTGYQLEGLSEIENMRREADTMNTVKFAWHPWDTINNLGNDGFKHNIHYVKFDRFKLYQLTPFPYAVVVPARDAALVQHGAGNIAPSAGSMATVVRKIQMPSESAKIFFYHNKRWGGTILESLTAQDEYGVKRAYRIYGVISEKLTKDFALCNVDAWLEDVQERIRESVANGVMVDYSAYNIKEPVKVQLTLDEAVQAADTLSEIKDGFERAIMAILDPSDGVLPRTKEALELAESGGEGKRIVDNLDRWCLKQFPDFPLDTEAARSREMIMQALKVGSPQNAGGSMDMTAFNNLMSLATATLEQNAELTKRLATIEAKVGVESVAQPAKKSRAASPAKAKAEDKPADVATQVETQAESDIEEEDEGDLKF